MADSHITLSLSGYATYDTYATIFRFLAGKAEWQRRGRGPEPTGWNISLNGQDVNVVDVDDDGIRYRPPTDDTWETFGESQFILWDAIDTIDIF